MKRFGLIIPVLVVLGFVAVSSLFIVDEREKALILRFGRVVDTKEEPGLAFRVPFIDAVARYDSRILSRDLDPIEITPLDDRRLVVDAFARYRIADVNKFREATGAEGDQAIAVAGRRLDSILRSQTREILGSVSSNDILSSDRAALMLRIRNGAISDAEDLGLEVVDVRLKRTDLPRENLDATFGRMRAEREREATDERARGQEAAQRIRAQADRTVVELVSDANRQAEITRGEADLVLGSRVLGTIESGAMGVHQRFGNWLTSAIMRRLYRIDVTDLGPYRAVRADLLTELAMTEMTFGWPTEMMVKAARRGARIVEVPVTWSVRHSGDSKVSGTVKGTILSGWYLLSVTFKHAFGRRPAPFRQ